MPDEGSPQSGGLETLLSGSSALHLAAGILEAALHEPGPERLLRLMAPLFATTKAALIHVDPIHPRESVSHIVGLSPELTAAFINRRLDQDHLFAACRQLPPGCVALGSELLTQEQTRCAPLWAALAVPAGAEYRLLAVLENSGVSYSVLSLLRSEREFTALEKELLCGLVPHLQMALTIARRLRLAEAGRNELIHRFDHARQPVVILDRSGYALYVNTRAAQLFERCDGVTLKFGRCLFHDVTTQSQFETAVRLASDHRAELEPPLTEIVVNRPSGQAPYELAVMPVRRPSDRALMPEGTGCLVLIEDATAPQTVAPDRLMRVYGLTVAEAKVCEALLARGALHEAAELLHITPNTARSHLKHVYAKLGVSNQAQLMQRLTLMARASRPADVYGTRALGAH